MTPATGSPAATSGAKLPPMLAPKTMIRAGSTSGERLSAASAARWMRKFGLVVERRAVGPRCRRHRASRCASWRSRIPARADAACGSSHPAASPAIRCCRRKAIARRGSRAARPVVPSGRVRIVRRRKPSGASQHAVAAVEAWDFLERAIVAARQVAASAWTRPRAANGRQQANANQRRLHRESLRALASNASHQSASAANCLPDYRGRSGRCRLRPGSGFADQPDDLGCPASSAKPRRRHAHARLEGAVERDRSSHSRRRARSRAPAICASSRAAQPLAGLTDPVGVQEIVEIAVAEALVDDAAQHLLARPQPFGQCRRS